MLCATDDPFGVEGTGLEIIWEYAWAIAILAPSGLCALYILSSYLPK